MSDAAKVVIDNGSVFAGKENLEFYCKQLRGRLGDNPAECEHLWLVKLKLANPRLMDPRVYSLLKSFLPDMIDILEEVALEDILEEVALQRKITDSGRQLVKERGLEGQHVFSCRSEGDRVVIRDYSVDTYLNETHAMTICDSRASLKEDEVYTWSMLGTVLTVPFLLSEVLSRAADSICDDPDMLPAPSTASK